MSSAPALLSGIAMRGRARVALAALVLALPPLAIGAWSSAYADRLGTGIAAWLTAVLPTVPAQTGGDELIGFSGDEASFDAGPTVQSVSLSTKRPAQPARAHAQPTRGIRISAAQVLGLAARRAMPHAVYVKSNAERPAGLLLEGVSALGVGLRDGDVLTEAAGQKATSVAAVVGIVLAARSRQASEISGRFYRGSVPFLLTVEQPYPQNQPQ